jgi:hypothetical protein
MATKARFHPATSHDAVDFAWRQVKRRRRATSAGIDGIIRRSLMTPDRGEQLVANISATLRDGTYHPQALLARCLRDTEREVNVLTVRDTIVHWVVLNALAVPRALTVQEAHAHAREAITGGARYAVTLDVAECYASIEPGQVLHRAAPLLDKRLRQLLRLLLTAPQRQWRQRDRRPKGLAAGTPLASVGAELVLRDIDAQISRVVPPGVAVVRYADDIIILAASIADAVEAESAITQLITEQGLRTTSDKRQAADVADGFDWLGLHLRLAAGGRVLWNGRRRVSMRICDAKNEELDIRIDDMVGAGKSMADVQVQLARLEASYGPSMFRPTGVRMLERAAQATRHAAA